MKMTQETYNNLKSVEGAYGDICIIAIDVDHINIAKEVSLNMYKTACEDQSIQVDDWEDSTQNVHFNFPSIEDLEDCGRLEDLENLGYHINID